MLQKPTYINTANYSIQDAWAGAQVAPDPDPIKTVCAEWEKADKSHYEAWMKRHYYTPYRWDDNG
jgi:hypothetical protein